MLEHVALGQSRFMTPGLSPDPRGVVLGRFGLLLFPTLEGVVAWFRLYSAESSLDELLPGMEILRVKTPLGSRELVVKMVVTASYAMDRVARCARLVGGAAYTGTSKHFVKYRDDRSPYGYDATEIAALPGGAAFMLHGDDFTQVYAAEGDIRFDRLLFRLSLRRIPGGQRAGDGARELLLVVASGLGEGVVRYLWRNRVEARIGLCRPRGESAFDDFGRRKSYVVLRLRELPPRILDLFLATPGVDVFRLVSDNVAVAFGWEHVIDLASCASVFDESRFYAFWGGEDRVDVIDGPLELSGIEHLTRFEIAPEEGEGAPILRGGLEVGTADPVGVKVRLAPSLTPPRRVIGALVPAAHAERVKRLVFLLPQSSLRDHRVAVTDRGILLVTSPDADIIPLGQLLAELAPGILVPLGMDLVPRVAPEVLAATLGHGAGLYTVFPHDGPPFQVSEAALVPLERRAVARIEVARATVLDAAVPAPGAPAVVNDPVGRFALWGFPAPGEALPALPPGERPGEG